MQLFFVRYALFKAGISTGAIAPVLSRSLVSPARRRVLFAGLFFPWLLAGCGKRDEDKIRQKVELHVASDGDALTFIPDNLLCPTGAEVRLIFTNAGKYISFEHNWVLILAGTADAINQAALQAGEQNGWVPPNDKRVLAATAMCGKGEKAFVDFIAPEPGDYPFLCTNPGHGEVMRGMLHVIAA